MRFTVYSSYTKTEMAKTKKFKNHNQNCKQHKNDLHKPMTSHQKICYIWKDLTQRSWRIWDFRIRFMHNWVFIQKLCFSWYAIGLKQNILLMDGNMKVMRANNKCYMHHQTQRLIPEILKTFTLPQKLQNCSCMSNLRSHTIFQH